MLYSKITKKFAVNIVINNSSKVGPNSLKYAISLNTIFDKPTDLKEEKDYHKRIDMIKASIDYLDVENSLRYIPKNNLTFCNVYAHDLCHLLGIYLPRIWWKDGYLEEVGFNISLVSVKYGFTVFEQTCNQLFKWLNEFGKSYGWVKEVNIENVRCQIEKGTIGVAIGRNIDLSKSGHISILIPSDISKDGTINLQTEAGKINRKYFNTPWWNYKNDLEIEFWYHQI